MDPSKMYNPLLDLPDHHPAHHRQLHPEHHHGPFLKKKRKLKLNLQPVAAIQAWRQRFIDRWMEVTSSCSL